MVPYSTTHLNKCGRHETRQRLSLPYFHFDLIPMLRPHVPELIGDKFETSLENGEEFARGYKAESDLNTAGE